MHYVCWVSSWSPARRRQAKPRCTHQRRVDRQWLTASCDTGRAGCGQAAVCVSGCGSEREHHLARRRGDAEAPGECQIDGLEKIQPLGRSLEHTSAPAPTSPLDGRGRFILGSEQTTPCRRAHKLPLQLCTQGWVACAQLKPLSEAATRHRARPLPNSVTCISEQNAMNLFQPLTQLAFR